MRLFGRNMRALALCYTYLSSTASQPIAYSWKHAKCVFVALTSVKTQISPPLQLEGRDNQPSANDDQFFRGKCAQHRPTSLSSISEDPTNSTLKHQTLLQAVQASSMQKTWSIPKCNL